MSMWIYAAAVGGMATVGMIAAVALTRGEPIRRMPPAEPEERTEEFGADSAFATELHEIGVELAEPNHVPLHLAAEPEPDEPQQDDMPEPVEEPAPEQETEPYPSEEPAWWGLPPAAHEKRWTADPDEPTPLFHAPGKHRYPDDLEIESFTNSWNRAELKQMLDMAPEEYGERAA